MSRVALPPRVELNCISAEKGWGCTAICANAICVKSRTATVAIRTGWNRDFTSISFGNELLEREQDCPRRTDSVRRKPLLPKKPSCPSRRAHPEAGFFQRSQPNNSGYPSPVSLNSFCDEQLWPWEGDRPDEYDRHVDAQSRA